MADQEDDPTRWNKPFLSANDGTSGVAFLMELAHHLPDLPTKFGIDIVLFDAEEYIFNPGTTDGQGDQYFLGSEHFAREYVRNRRAHTWQYEAAVLFDLFAAKDARLAVEGYSLAVAPHIVQEIWTIAAQLKAKSFTFDRGFQRSYLVLDDHVPLQRAGIPAIDIIDFDYLHWHKLSDTPEQVCPRQMEEVARVIHDLAATKRMTAKTLALLLAVPLILMGLISAWMQVQARRALAARTHVPSDELAYLRSRHRRRTFAAMLMILTGTMIAGAYLSGMEATADDLKPATDANGQKQQMSQEHRQFIRFWAVYWIAVILITAVLVAVAMIDAWSTRRYWHGVYRELKEEHQARLRRDLAVYRQSRDDRGARRGPL